MTSQSTFTWCLLMPLIHLFSLISNILCIIIFCSNTFIKKPIAIYFICLLISDSITLLIGYIEMIDRETSMMDKSSFLCMVNGKFIHTLTEMIYSFMERFCLEWMLYKVLWTRASTILLAILSVQRCRTFFSLSYHESRLCACFACVFSIICAVSITCLEWIGVQYDQVSGLSIFSDILQLVNENNSSKEFYLYHLNRSSNETNVTYQCVMEYFNSQFLFNQSNCSFNATTSDFYYGTKSLLTHRDPQILDMTANLLTSLPNSNNSLSNDSILMSTIHTAKSSDILPRLFEKRACHLTINYSIWLKLYHFFNSVQFTVNRRSLAIFFANALPSFIVVLANLLSLKVIYFSESLKYLKQSTQKNRRKNRLQNDLRAFLVILIESFSIILISWGIPILLTMYHCKVLYVLVVSSCPKIKDYLALFLFTDLFNSSTNCLLYSLSGKLFRRKFLSLIKTILTCGRGTLWNREKHLLMTRNLPLDRQLSNNPSTNTNPINAKPPSQSGSLRYSERLSSPIMLSHNNQTMKFTYSPRANMSISKQHPYQWKNQSRKGSDEDGSLCVAKTSDNHQEGKSFLSEYESENVNKSNNLQTRKSSQSIKSFLIDKVRSFGSPNSASGKSNLRSNPPNLLIINKKKVKSKRKHWNTLLSRGQIANDVSLSSSSYTGSTSHGSQRKYSAYHRFSTSKVILNNNFTDDPSLIDNSPHENLTSV